MTNPDSRAALLEVLWDEDCEEAWAVGHHDRGVFVRAVIANLREIWQGEDANNLGRRYETAVEAVEHMWLRDLGPNVERSERCEPDAEGATAMTYLHVWAAANG